MRPEAGPRGDSQSQPRRARRICPDWGNFGRERVDPGPARARYARELQGRPEQGRPRRRCLAHRRFNPICDPWRASKAMCSRMPVVAPSQLTHARPAHSPARSSSTTFPAAPPSYPKSARHCTAPAYSQRRCRKPAVCGPTRSDTRRHGESRRPAPAMHRATHGPQ